MPLVPLEIEPVPGELPPEVVAFLADADARIDAFFDLPLEKRCTFYPSDYELGYRTLMGAKRLAGDVRSLCEWGSGFGVVAGLAALLGYDAHGIEVDPELVAASRRLLADHDLAAKIHQGSFIPDEYARYEQLSDVETMTDFTQAAAYNDMDEEIEDFDVIFAYPWPDEEEQYCELFRRFGDYGAVMITYSSPEGMRAYRRVGSSRRVAR